MNELEIIYYYSQKTNNIIPFVKMKSDSNEKKFVIDDLSEGTNSICEDYFVLYYIDLLKNGCSFNDIEMFIKKEISKKEENGNFRCVKSLLIQKDLLNEANELLNEDENVRGLMEVYEMPSIQTSIKAHRSLEIKKRRFRN